MKILLEKSNLTFDQIHKMTVNMNHDLNKKLK